LDTNVDDLAKSLKTVTPAEAGVQISLNLLDSRFRGNDKNGEIATFCETINVECISKKNCIHPVHNICLFNGACPVKYFC
jgi:hypothetical protein